MLLVSILKFPNLYHFETFVVKQSVSALFYVCSQQSDNNIRPKTKHSNRRKNTTSIYLLVIQ